MLLRAFVFFASLFFCIEGISQDQILLRYGGVLECFIVQADDSIIVFRLLDYGDDEYEIPYNETYGYVLEDPQRLQKQDNEVHFKIEFSNPKRKRRPVFKERNGIIFRLIGDTTLLPLRGSIIQIMPDSIQIEVRRKRVPERITYALRDFTQFGYTTIGTELLTLIIAPVSALKDGSLQLYRKLAVQNGWTWVVKEIPPEAPKARKIRKYRNGRKIRLPKAVRRKA